MSRRLDSRGRGNARRRRADSVDGMPATVRRRDPARCRLLRTCSGRHTDPVLHQI